MKKDSKFAIILSFVFLLAMAPAVFSEDDPFAGLDMGDDSGAPKQVTEGNSGVPADDPFAGIDTGEAGDTSSGSQGDDPFAGLDAGDSRQAGADVLFPDMGNEQAPAGTVTAPGSDEDLLSGLDQTPADTKQAAAEQSKMQDAAPAKKTEGPATKNAVTRTNDIYTKSSYIGGYRNLREIVPWGLKATSELSAGNSPAMLADNIIDTAWVEGKKAGGKKQAITFDFAEKYFIGLFEQKYRKAEIRQFKILNGYASDKDLWKKHFRVRKMKITKNNKLQFYVMLRDTMNWQTITMKKPLIVSPGDVIKAEILEVYPEVRREDDTYTAITEFTFIGGPYGEQVLPKYIQAHMQ